MIFFHFLFPLFLTSPFFISTILASPTMGQGPGGMTGDTRNESLIQAPFVILADLQEQVHIVKDRFLLRQIINSSEIISHVKIIALSFEFMKDRFLNRSINFETGFELKLHLILNQIANTLNAGLQFLPQAVSHAQWVSWVGGFLMREDAVLIVKIIKHLTHNFIFRGFIWQAVQRNI